MASLVRMKPVTTQGWRPTSATHQPAKVAIKPAGPIHTKARKNQSGGVRCFLMNHKPSQAANTMAEVCEAIGADWQEIVPALRLDRRIGQYAYINPGLGIAGGKSGIAKLFMSHPPIPERIEALRRA